jgi:hypothetical protein
MTWDAVARQYGLSARDIQQFQNSGITPDQVQAGGQQGYSMGDIIAKFGAAPAGAQAPAPAVSPTAGTQPETNALAQMAQIDPTSEAVRTALGQSYLSNLQNIPQAPGFNAPTSAAAPSQADVQSYLDLYKQIDPSGYAAHAGLADQMSAYLANAQAQAARGSELDPTTVREIEQQTRAGQAARGNVYGTPQLVQEAMQRGTAGEARAQQRLQNLSGALGQQQSYLGSGTGLGDIANTLYGQGYQRYLQGYQQQLNQFNAQQGARQQAQTNALNYLGSGQTPYQAGSSYLNMAQQNAANAAQGGVQYNPASLGQNYLSNQQQQYGLDVGSQAQNYYNSLANYGYGGGGAGKNPGASALAGAATGALSGAAAGTTISPGIGTVVGGIGGAVLGGAGGYFS